MRNVHPILRSHILNHAFFALIGLCELEARTGGDIHKAAAARLSTQLAKFDLGYWSRYDLRFVAPATQAYHSLHISLLQVAGDLLSDPFFNSTAIRWSSDLSLSRLPAPGSCKQSVVRAGSERCLITAGLTVAMLGPASSVHVQRWNTMLGSIGYRVIVASWQPGPELTGAELRSRPWRSARARCSECRVPSSGSAE